MLVDCGNIIFHVFSPQGRLHYDLERKWAFQKVENYEPSITPALQEKLKISSPEELESLTNTLIDKKVSLKKGVKLMKNEAKKRVQEQGLSWKDTKIPGQLSSRERKKTSRDRYSRVLGASSEEED